jgi:RimJ/RimL family protein N-acetyltransferase
MLSLWSKYSRRGHDLSQKDHAPLGMGQAPELVTDRLRLRMPRIEDFEHRAAFYASDRSVHEDGPVSRAEAWRIWASEVGQWPLLGYGPFSVEHRSTQAYVGEVGIYNPVGFPEPELGWFVLPEAEGRGFAAEAARAVMVWVRDAFGWDHVINIIAPANDRSIALAKRLGGVHTNRPGIDEGDVVILHDLSALA